MARPLKLITALGDRPDLVLQFIDFFNGGDRYRYKAEAAEIRKKFLGRELVEIHLVCTGEKTVQDAMGQLRKIAALDYPELAAHIHEIRLQCDDIACAGDDVEMRERVYAAVQIHAADDLIIASGGRKPVTQRLIEAALLFGCLGYLTITSQRGKEQRQYSEFFNVLWTTARRFSEERRARIIKDELGDNFRSLYLLPLTVANRLRQEPICVNPDCAQAEIAWLARLPKADLHCHLGGSFDAALLKKLAAKLLDDLGIGSDERDRLRSALENGIGCPLSELAPDDLLRLAGPQAIHCLVGLKALFKPLPWPAHLANAVLVEALSIGQIEALSWHKRETSVNGHGLDWYMACGDLGGSALLQTSGTLRMALRWLLGESAAENARFLEVRFSPENYTRGGLTIQQVIESLLDEAREFVAHNQIFQVNFLVMATRHKQIAAMKAHVDAAVAFGHPGGGNGPRITGFDLAGQEEGYDPEIFQELFLPLYRNFMNITIHAGEMEKDEKIWQAIYPLHARRIGHGLKLINNPKMMGYIRDHGIAIEMCPSSNRQTNGFRRFDRDEDGADYPLKQYLDFGLAVTVNTDNRGISRTTLANEYLEAARMTRGSLTRWEILRLVKNGFKAAFLPKDEKDALLKRIDEEVFNLVLNDFFPEYSP